MSGVDEKVIREMAGESVLGSKEFAPPFAVGNRLYVRSYDSGKCGWLETAVFCPCSSQSDSPVSLC